MGLLVLHLLIALISSSGMGMGDVRLAGLTGFFLGWVSWQAVVLDAVGAFLLQAVLAVLLLLSRRAVIGRTRLPFGPCLPQLP